MKKLNASFITGAVGQPIKQGTLEHIQSAYQQILDAIVKGLVANPLGATIIFGCVNSTPGGGTFTISDGAIYYNGEVYLVDAATLTPGGGQVVIGTIVTTQLTAANADPVTFTDNNTHDVHDINKIVLSNGVSGSTPVGDYVDFDFLTIWKEYTIQQADVTTDTGSVTVSSSFSKFRYRIIGKTMFVQLHIRLQPTTTGSPTRLIIDLSSIFISGLDNDLRAAGINTTTDELLSISCFGNTGIITIKKPTPYPNSINTSAFSAIIEIQ